MTALIVNGRAVEVADDPRTPLLYVLRDTLGLNGAKFGCGLGQCGACTVMVDGVAVFSCITPIATVAGGKITTSPCSGSIVIRSRRERADRRRTYGGTADPPILIGGPG